MKKNFSVSQFMLLSLPGKNSAYHFLRYLAVKIDLPEEVPEPVIFPARNFFLCLLNLPGYCKDISEITEVQQSLPSISRVM